MDCPYCHQKMEEGYIESARAIYFTENPHRFSFTPNKDDINLAPLHITDGSRCPALHCQKCKKIIIQY